MTVYVDEPRSFKVDYTNWCHLFADTEEELDQWVAWACKAQRDPNWINPKWKHRSKGLSGEFPHYDLTPRKRAEALKLGAKFIPLREWLKPRMPQKDE